MTVLETIALGKQLQGKSEFEIARALMDAFYKGKSEGVKQFAEKLKVTV